MGIACIIPGCSSSFRNNVKKKLNGEKSVSFFSCPLKDSVLYEKWLQAIPHIEKLRNYDHVCELHFKKEDIDTYFEVKLAGGTIWKYSKVKPQLKKGAVPCIFPDATEITKKRKCPAMHDGATEINGASENKKRPPTKRRKSTFVELLEFKTRVPEKIVLNPTKRKKLPVNEETEISVCATIGNELLEPKTRVSEKILLNPCTNSFVQRVLNAYEEATKNCVPAAFGKKLLEPKTEVSEKISLNPCTNNYVKRALNASESATKISVPAAFVKKLSELQSGPCSYDSIRDNITTLTENSSWSSNVSDNFTALILWNLDYTIEKWIVFTKDLKTKVFIKGVETSFGDNFLLSIKNIYILMKLVEEAMVCKGIPHIVNNCHGHLKDEHSKQTGLCANCRSQKRNLVSSYSSLGWWKRRQYLAYSKQKNLRLEKEVSAENTCK